MVKTIHRVVVSNKDGQTGRGHAGSSERALSQPPGEHSDLLGQAGSGRAASAPTQARVKPSSLLEDFGLTKKELAETIGLAPEALYKTRRLHAPRSQSRLREVAEILTRVSAWAGGRAQAMAWYRAEPIPAFGGRTAESLVKSGHAGQVRDYLDSIAIGGFA